MTPDQYWKIKAAVLERQLLDEQVKTATQQVALKLAVLLREAGLDPNAAYTMDDATQSVNPAAGPQLAVDNSAEV